MGLPCRLTAGTALSCLLGLRTPGREQGTVKGWSASLAWDAADGPDLRRKVIILFAVNALFHFAWSPLFFRLHRPDWAFYEVTFLWFSVLAIIIGVAPLSALAAWIVVPYLLWVTFASYLNLTVIRLNGPFGVQASPG